jgi:hypothetical protein
MYDQSVFLQTLSRSAVFLPARYHLESAPIELTESLAAVLGLSGSGVTMAEDGRLRFVTAVSQASGELERTQEVAVVLRNLSRTYEADAVTRR